MAGIGEGAGKIVGGLTGGPVGGLVGGVVGGILDGIFGGGGPSREEVLKQAKSDLLSSVFTPAMDLQTKRARKFLNEVRERAKATQEDLA